MYISSVFYSGMYRTWNFSRAVNVCNNKPCRTVLVRGLKNALLNGKVTEFEFTIGGKTVSNMKHAGDRVVLSKPLLANGRYYVNIKITYSDMAPAVYTKGYQ